MSHLHAEEDGHEESKAISGVGPKGKDQIPGSTAVCSLGFLRHVYGCVQPGLAIDRENVCQEEAVPAAGAKNCSTLYLLQEPTDSVLIGESYKLALALVCEQKFALQVSRC